MSNDQRLLQTHACAVQVKPNPFKCGAVAHSDWACPPRRGPGLSAMLRTSIFFHLPPWLAQDL